MHGLDHVTAWEVAAICLGGLLLLQMMRGDAPRLAVVAVAPTPAIAERLDRHEFEENAGDEAESSLYLPEDCLM